MGQTKQPDARNQLAQMQERMRQNVKYAGPDSASPASLANPQRSTTEPVGAVLVDREGVEHIPGAIDWYTVP